MRYRLPDDCRALSHAGRELEIADDGTLDLEPADAAALAPHGVIVVPGPQSPPADEGRPGKKSKA